jgi:peptidoglycan/LPS O-acetylase OafA/YrhL
VATIEAAPTALPVPVPRAAEPAVPEAKRPRPRIQILDGLRLVAALMVLSWHYVAFGHGPDKVPYAQVGAVYPIAAYGWLGVELFFLISGFVITMSSLGHTLGEFVASRVTRLYPAYWFAILLTTGVLVLFPIATHALPGPDVALNLTMFQSAFGVGSVDAVYWTLWVELHFYLLFSLVVWRGVTYRRAVVFAGAWLAASIPAVLIGGTLDSLLIGDYAPFFVAGLAFFLMHTYGQRPLLWIYVVASFVLGIHPVLRTLDGSNSHLAHPIPQWPAVVALAVFYVLVGAVALGKLRVGWKWLTVAGAMTYPLYLVHEYIGWTIMKSLDGRVPGPVLYVGTGSLMLVLAWLIHRYVEQLLAPRIRRGMKAAFAALDRALHPVPAPEPPHAEALAALASAGHPARVGRDEARDRIARPAVVAHVREQLLAVGREPLLGAVPVGRARRVDDLSVVRLQRDDRSRRNGFQRPNPVDQ